MASAASWDVVVVGAGPAGAAMAARLAGLGHAVLLLDRARFPRAKPCGECLNPAAVAALDALGALGDVLAAGAASLSGWAIHATDGTGFRGRFPEGRRGLALPRAVLDEVLVRHAVRAGAAFRPGTRVVDVVREGGRVVGVRLDAADGETLRARLVVGADGLRSVVSRRLGLVRRSPRLRKLALTAHVEGLEVEPGTGELHVTPGGCVGIAAVGGGRANVTVVSTGAEARRVAGRRETHFDAALRTVRGGSARRVDEVLATGPFDWPVRRAIAEGALLVGDAAGYYDPFTGQGIFRALRGAELAAGVADGALRAGGCSATSLAAYEHARAAAFRPGERLQRAIELVVARPRLFAFAARRLRARPAVADALVAVTGDVAPVRSLLSAPLLAALLR